MRKFVIWSLLAGLLALMSVPAMAQTTLTVNSATGTNACVTPRDSQAYFSISLAISCANAGDTINVENGATGTYGGFTVDKDLTITGGVTGIAINGQINVNAPLELINFEVATGGEDAILVAGNFTGLIFQDLLLNGSGITFEPDATLDQVAVLNSEFSGGISQGMTQNFSCGVNPPFAAPTGGITNLVVDGNDFSGFEDKGIYLTQVSDAVFLNNSFDGSALVEDDDSFPPKALEINANCDATYDNIYILNSTFISGTRTNSGAPPDDRTSAIQLSAQRSAVLDAVTVDGVSITDYHQGIALYAAKFYPGTTDDAAIGSVTVRRSRFWTHSPDAVTSGGFAELWGIINASDAQVDARYNWWGSNDGPNNVDATPADTSPGDNNTSTYGDNIGDPADLYDGAVDDFGAGVTTFDPWYQLTLTAESPIFVNETSAVTGEFINSDGSTPADATYDNAGTGITGQSFLVTVPIFPDNVTAGGDEVTTPADLGTGTYGGLLTFIGGLVTDVFTAGNTPGTATVDITLDNNIVGESGNITADIVILARTAIYDSVPAPGTTLALDGLAANNPQTTTLAISNVGDSGSTLDVTLDSISAGYTIVSGLPITGLTPEDGALDVVIECNVPQPAGTLTLLSNEGEGTLYSYPLTCIDTTEATPTPIPTTPPGDGGGDAGDTGTVTELPDSVEQLPTTGESPAWRDPLLLLLAALLALGGWLGSRRVSRA